MTKTKVLFINTEMQPYMPESRMAMIGRNLPQGIQDAGHEIRTFMPRFGTINERRNQLHEVIRLSGMNLIINETDHPLIIKVASIQSARMQVYFIDNDDYFTHRNQYADENDEYEDNGERAFFYVRGVVETVRKLRWQPDVIVCQGWFAAVAPVYIRKHYGDDPCFRHSKIVTALYNDTFNRPFHSGYSATIKCEGITKSDLSEIRDKAVTHSMLCKLAIKFSDGVVVAEKGVSDELLAYAEQKERKILKATEETLNIGKYEKFLQSFGEPEEAPAK